VKVIYRKHTNLFFFDIICGEAIVILMANVEEDMITSGSEGGEETPTEQ